MIQLEVRFDALTLPAGDYPDREPGATPLLVAVYPEGDCDRAAWPMLEFERDAKILASALFDARGMGWIPSDCRVVLLPDGTEFEFDQYVP